MYCPHCNYSDIPSQARFCPNCGETISASGEPSAPSATLRTSQVEVVQEVGRVEGGKATALEIGQAGNVTVVIQTSGALPEIKPAPQPPYPDQGVVRPPVPEPAAPGPQAGPEPDDTATLAHLAERLARGRLALFIGGDLPREVTGLPSRRELAAGLARRAGLPDALALSDVAQRVARGGNRWDFTDYLIRELDSTGKAPQPFHALAASLPAMHFIAHGSVDLLKRAFDAAGRPVNHLRRASQLAFRNPACPNLFQLYGLTSEPDTLVVTEDDHLSLWRDPDKAQMLDRIRLVFEENTILFIGYDLSDPDFKLLWREVLDRMGRFASGAYAVVQPAESEGTVQAGLSADERRVWEDRRVRIVDAEPVALLGQLA